MAFRPPREQEQGVPSLGYRLSSNRQPGIEQSNNRMPQEGGPGARYQGRRNIPKDQRKFDLRRNMPMPMPMPSPDFDYRIPMPSPYFDYRKNMPMPMPSPDFDYENYLQEGIQPMSGGIMGAMPPERQMAELTQPQLDFMGSSYGRPDFFSSYQDYKNAVDSYEDKGFLGGIFGGGQDPATDPEIIKQLKETYGTIPFKVPGIV